MESACNIEILAERTQHTAGLSFSYRLGFSKGFWLTVESEAEQERIFLGSDMESVWALFSLCVQGCVTPCTLEDVFVDYFYTRGANIGI